MLHARVLASSVGDTTFSRMRFSPSSNTPCLLLHNKHTLRARPKCTSVLTSVVLERLEAQPSRARAVPFPRQQAPRDQHPKLPHAPIPVPMRSPSGAFRGSRTCQHTTPHVRVARWAENRNIGPHSFVVLARPGPLIGNFTGRDCLRASALAASDGPIPNSPSLQGVRAKLSRPRCAACWRSGWMVREVRAWCVGRTRPLRPLSRDAGARRGAESRPPALW